MLDRRAVVLAAGVGLPLLLAPSAIASEDFTVYSKSRLRQAKKLDIAIGMINEYAGARVLRRRINGIDALVVARDMSFRDLARLAPRDIRQVGSGVWQVRRTIVVVNNATFSVGGKGVREIRLLSDRSGWASIVTRDASLRFRGGRDRRLLIHSWNPRTHRTDGYLEDGRASVSVRWSGRLDSFDTIFKDLGFYEGRVSGVAVIGPEKAHGGTGNVYRSRFEGNVYGAFSYNADRMRWIGNEFVKNHVYGFDPHDGSNNFLTERNYAAENGKHGIIFSRFCAGNVIRNNISEKNGWHGIVLDDGKAADGPSNYNEVYDNVVRDNKRVGISIDGSQNTIIRDNEISGSRYGIRLYGPTSTTTIRHNEIRDSGSFGIFVDRPTRKSWIVDNRIDGAFTGVRVRSARSTVIRGNKFVNMNGHAIKFDGVGISNSSITSNLLGGRGTSPVYVQVPKSSEDEIEMTANEQEWNFHFAHDLSRLLGWVIGPAFWAGLLGLALIGPWMLKLAERFGWKTVE